MRGRFLISTHYTRYDYILFALNFAATVFVLFPKLPIVSDRALKAFKQMLVLIALSCIDYGFTF